MTRRVNNVRDVGVGRGERVGHHAAVVRARLLAHVLGQVGVELGAVLSFRPLEGRLGARAEDRDELAVVAAETRDTTFHGVAGHRGIHGGDAVLERRVELLQFATALLFGFGVV